MKTSFKSLAGRYLAGIGMAMLANGAVALPVQIDFVRSTTAFITSLSVDAATGVY